AELWAADHPASQTPADTHDYAVVPAISNVEPYGSASIGGGESVTITGSGFLNATSVAFGGYGANFQIVDDATIVATAPAYDGTIGGDHAFVDVFNNSLAGDSRALGELTCGV